MSFPKNFVWGAAAASYQIEGGAFDDGKGLSVWDMMCRRPDAIFEKNTGDVSCDNYHRYEEDAGLMGEIGLKAYRLSISWPRVLPEGTGSVNQKGIDFYSRLVDALLKNGVEPWITLFHWDYPYALYNRGGWLNPASSDWFADYTMVIMDALSDRVTHWMTQNEPQCFLGLGHYDGYHAPGLKLIFKDILQATHNALLAHGKSVQMIRAHSKSKALIGAAPVGVTYLPASEDDRDIEAARTAMFTIKEKDYWNNTWYADPMILGHYPEDGLKVFEEELPVIGNNDLKTICQPLDFYGANMYWADRIRAMDAGPELLDRKEGYPITTMDWPVTPEVLYWGPKFFYERYKLPIVVTENGMANNDWVHVDGKVHDPERIDYITRYLREYRRAINDGVESWGYFVWSIMDNFEWAFGYKQRFGLIHCDYQTKKRTLKDSAHWYNKVISSNGKNI